MIPVVMAAASTALFHATIPATANVFGAGAGGAAANGGGTAPIRIVLHGARTVQITQARGRVSCCGGGNTFNDADGGRYYRTDILSSGGISGIVAPVNMFLVGVFVGAHPSPGAGPARLNVTGMRRTSDAYPQLNQTFFVGSGRYVRPGATGVRRMHVPAGATSLVLGFADSNGFHGTPGAYDDNVGNVAVQGRLLNVSPVPPRTSTANLIVNGSFERPAVSGSFATYGRGTQIPGWRVTMGTVDVIGPNWRPADGRQSLDLDGTPGPGAIAQAIRSIPGRAYTLRFALAGNPECAPSLKRLRIAIGNIARTYTFDASHTSDGAMGWRFEQLVFSAHGSATYVKFTSLDAPGSDCGPALDAISVTARAHASSAGHKPPARPAPKPCYVNSYAYAKIGPCFGRVGTQLVVTLLRSMKVRPARLRLDRVLVNGVPAVVLQALSGSGTAPGSVYIARANKKLCAGPGFPKTWSVTLIDVNGRRQGQIGSFTITGCP